MLGFWKNHFRFQISTYPPLLNGNQHHRPSSRLIGFLENSMAQILLFLSERAFLANAGQSSAHHILLALEFEKESLTG